MSGPVDPERVELVRQGLAEGLSWSAIGVRVGCSKNSIAGLVRRHIYGPANGFRHPDRVGIPVAHYNIRRLAAEPKPAPRRPPRPAPVVSLPAPPPVPVQRCQFPLNDGRPWRFCEAVAVHGRPYCDRHCRIAYHNYQAAA